MTALRSTTVGAAGHEPTNWTTRLRARISGLVPPGEALPDRQPAYVVSWIYVFGVLTLAALVVVLVSGACSPLGGVAWWHVSALGHFVNSLHLWSVELFFAFMVIHLWGKFWMAAWRGKRALTWVTGVRGVRGLDRHRVHRLPVPVELRRAVDQRRGQGRAEPSASARGSTC